MRAGTNEAGKSFNQSYFWGDTLFNAKVRYSIFAVVLAIYLSVVPGIAYGAASTQPSINAGHGSSFAVATDGTVWAWGQNVYGQLGDGSTTNRTSPVQVQGLTGTIAVDASYLFSLALKSDGTVWSWGYNYYGQLGNGSTKDQTTSAQVQGLTGVIAISAGVNHSLALKNDGTVWAWGGNGIGQLGDGTLNDRSTPVQVQGFTGITAIAGGDGRSMALKSDGTVWIWGDYSSGTFEEIGQLLNRAVPVQVQGLTGVIAIAQGDHYSLAVKNDGTVWAWGWNNYGQLGDGTATGRPTPVQVQGLTSVRAIAASNVHSLAIKNDGTVWTWGFTFTGNGYISLQFTPVLVQELAGVTAVSAGFNHTLALKSDGTVWALGDNYGGQLGDGTTTDRYVPVQIFSLDKTAPITTDNAPAGWSNKDVAVTLKASDNISGVAATYFTVDGGERQQGTSVTITTEGKHTISYWSIDRAGNIESPHSTVVQIDKTPPTLNVVMDPTVLWPANNKMVPVHATVSAADSLSGIDSVVLTSIASNVPNDNDIQGAQVGTLDTDFMLLAAKGSKNSERIYTITYQALDKAGNQINTSVTLSVSNNPKKSGK